MDENNDVSSEGFGEVEERLPDESTEETSDNVGATDSKEESGEAGEETQVQEQTEIKEEAKPELTEKGTKLDSNPQSALHQQLANEKRAKAEMERVLADPKLLARFMEVQHGVKVPVAEQSTTETSKRFKAEDFQNVDDIANKFNEIQDGFSQKEKQYEDTIAKLSSTVNDLVNGTRNSQIATTMEGDVTSLRSVPELNPKSSDYIPELEEKIGEEYVRLDFDPQTRQFRGNWTLKQIADKYIDAINLGKKAGSQRTQTVVKDKTEGRVRSSTVVKEELDTDKMNPGDSIAAGISKLRLR